MEYGYTISDRYVCRKPLGKGGNGSVYLAYDNKLLKYWAVKSCNNLSEREIYALKCINHFAFPRIVDVIKQDNMEFLVMDYIEGETLATYCKNHSVTEKQLLIWYKKIASALHYLHCMNPAVFYVDCKPENIMITPSGDIRIIDLGSIYVDSNRTQTISGTKFYAPSELGKSMPCATSDIYSLGMTMYRLVTKSSVEYRDIYGNLCPERINKNISSRLVRIIKKCTQINPKSRFQSMGDIIESLNSAQKTSKLHLPSLNIVANTILKLIIAASIIIIAYFFKQSSIYIVFLLFIALLLICKRPTYFTWETKKDIYKCSITITILLLFLLSSLLSTKSFASGIQKDVPKTERLDITLYDDNNRKLLVRPNAIWQVENDIKLSLSKYEVLEPSTITVICTNNSGTKSFSFDCALSNLAN